MVRVVRLERTVSWSQTRRDTNFAIPGYSISAIIPRRGRKSKIFLSVVIYVVKAAFMPLSAIGGNPANAGVTRLCGVSPCPVPDTATALPKQARYQLRYTRLFSFLCMIPCGEEKSKFFVSVGAAVVKPDFARVFSTGEFPPQVTVPKASGSSLSGKWIGYLSSPKGRHTTNCANLEQTVSV